MEILSSYRGLPVLITGAGGFIGSHLCRRLQELGARVHALVRPERAYPRLDGLHLEGVHRGDLGDLEAVNAAMQEARPAVIFHLAASLDRSRSLRALEVLCDSNINGTLNVLRAAAASGVELVVNAGSCEEYGRRSPPFTEGQEPEPLTPYAASKVTATLWCRTVHRAVGLPAVTARLFAVYGPGQPEDNLFPQLIRAAREGRPLEMTPGEQTRDFTWIGDAVEALLRIGRHPELGGEVLNVCTGHETSIREAVRLFSEVLGREIPVRLGALPYRESELFRVWGSANTLLGAVGYRPRTPLREGLERLARAEGLI